jgi:purine-cytosine permease-like protein
MSPVFRVIRSTEPSMRDKPSWSIFDSLFLGAILPFALMAVLGMIGAIFFSEPH